MYDIDTLEEQWRKYKRRKNSIMVLGVVAGVVVAGAGLYYSLSIGSSPNGDGERIPSVQPARKISDKDILQPPASDIKKIKGGMKIIFHDTHDTSPQDQASIPAKHIDIKVTPKRPKATIEDIEVRFKNRHDKADALFLAKHYYDAKQYTMALKWALEANKLDSNIEESWILFGKSKARLGSREEAIRILQRYIDTSGSKKAGILLDKIRRNKDF